MAPAELERSLVIERVRSDMRRARLEEWHLGRLPLDLDREAIIQDRRREQSLGQIARTYRISRTTVHRVVQGEIPSTALF